MRSQVIVMEEMKATLLSHVGTGLPLQIKSKDAEIQTVFVRGFADEKHNIALISQTPDSLGVNIIEIKNIAEIKNTRISSAA
jgi:hypothetical protein